MREVAIIGAGELGGAAAHVLARLDIARSIRLVDDSGTIAAGKALDIAQAAPIEGFATQVIGTTDVASAAGASVIVIADTVSGGEWQGDAAVQLVMRLARMAPRSVLACAGASHRDVIDRAVREHHLDRTRIVGTAPEALVSGARALAALALNASPMDVALGVIGRPPDHTVILWEHATLSGAPLGVRLAEPARRRLSARIAASWPPGPYALACAAAAAIEAIAGRSRRMPSCFVGPDTRAGTRTRTAALPVRLGLAGVVDVVIPELSTAERVALEGAMVL